MPQHSNVVKMDVSSDPWKKKQKVAPSDLKHVELVCRYEIFIQVDHFDEIVLFHRTGTRDELWTAIPFMYDSTLGLEELALSSYDLGRVVSQARAGTPKKAARRLLKQLFRSRAGYGWPGVFISSGLVSRDELVEVISELEKGFETVMAETRRQAAPIVQTAGELGLFPEPEAETPGIWRAQCPAGHVGLQLNNRLNEFYCGYCVRGGDEKTLKAFAENPEGKAGLRRKQS